MCSRRNLYVIHRTNEATKRKSAELSDTILFVVWIGTPKYLLQAMRWTLSMLSSLCRPHISDEYNKTVWIFESNTLKKVSFVISLHFWKDVHKLKTAFFTFCYKICILFCAQRCSKYETEVTSISAPSKYHFSCYNSWPPFLNTITFVLCLLTSIFSQPQQTFKESSWLCKPQGW